MSKLRRVPVVYVQPCSAARTETRRAAGAIAWRQQRRYFYARALPLRVLSTCGRHVSLAFRFFGELGTRSTGADTTVSVSVMDDADCSDSIDNADAEEDGRTLVSR